VTKRERKRVRGEGRGREVHITSEKMWDIKRAEKERSKTREMFS